PLQLVRGRIAGDLGGLDGGVRRIVAPEPGGVDDHPADHAGQAEADDRPVVAGPAPAAGLPAVVDLALAAERAGLEGGPAGPDEALLLAERLVAGGDDGSAVAAEREVGQAGVVVHLRSQQEGPVRDAGGG